MPRPLGNPVAITERKYYDSDLDSKTLTVVAGNFNTCLVNPNTKGTLFVPVLGNDINGRIGRKTSTITVRLRGEVIIPAIVNSGSAAGGVPPTIIRLVFFIDRQPNGNQPASQDVITSGGTQTAWDFFQTTTNFGRFKILKDKRFVLQNPIVQMPYAGNVYRDGLCKLFDFTVKFRKPVVTHFNQSNNGNYTDIVCNSFNVICGSSTTESLAVINYKFRATYLDS